MPKLYRVFVSSVKAENEIRALLFRLDFHLGLLSKALKQGNEKRIENQKTQLARIHKRLLELEHFPL